MNRLFNYDHEPKSKGLTIYGALYAFERFRKITDIHAFHIYPLRSFTIF